jgi:HAMP domain-containing protein
MTFPSSIATACAGLQRPQNDAQGIARPPFVQIDRGNFFHQMKVLFGPQRVFESSYAFTMSGAPFGEVRVGISIPLLRDAIMPSLRTSGAIALVALLISTGLAMVVSGATLAPLRDISAQLDRISAGQYDAPPSAPKSFAVFSGFGSFGGGADELGLVSRKISQVGNCAECTKFSAPCVKI